MEPNATRMTRIRPTSARPAARAATGDPHYGYNIKPTTLVQEELDDTVDKTIADDNEDSPDDHESDPLATAAFWTGEHAQESLNKSKSTATLQFHLQQQQQQRQMRFRPTSAPPIRTTSKAVSPTTSKTHKLDRDQYFSNQRDPEAAAAMSLEYLRAASERKREKDRQFAMQLAREELEYRKKMMLKTEQANKLSTLNGSRRTYSIGPDREGVHMIRVVDPSRACTDRLITVDVFRSELREFDKLSSASMGLSADKKRNKEPKPKQLQQPHQQQTPSTTSKASSSSRGTMATASQNQNPGQSNNSNSAHHNGHGHHTHSKSDLSKMDQDNKLRMLTKLDEKARVQEEMKTVLANTIELTKVLQEQLHELKLRGWNFTSRTSCTNL